MRALRTFLVVLFTVTVSLGHSTTANAQTAAVTGAIGGLAAAREALQGVKESISKLDNALKDRLSQASALIDSTLRDIDNLLERHRKGLIRDADALVTKTFDQANDALFQLTTGALGIEAAFSQDLNNSILNAGHVLSAVPFVKVKPFVAMAYPSVLVPRKSQAPYLLTLVGYFQHDLGSPRFTLPGSPQALPDSDVSLGVANQVVVSLPASYVRSHSGQTTKLSVSYPVRKRFLLGTVWDRRDIWVRILPAAAVRYTIHNTRALEDPVYDTITPDVENNTEAGKCDTVERTPSWPLASLAGTVDPAVHSLASSRIGGATIVDSRGNNPDGQNSSRVTFNNESVVLYQKARGSCDRTTRDGPIGFPTFRSGEGANKYDKVRVAVLLARIPRDVPWNVDGAPLAGDLGWGQQAVLEPSPRKDLTGGTIEIQDLSFDPPQTRSIPVGQVYRSPFLTIEASQSRLSLTVRTPVLK